MQSPQAPRDDPSPAPDRPDPRGRATAHAADRLRDAIVAGDLMPGARLSERAVHDRFGLSRTPVREALKVLQAEGLVTIEPHRGAVVTRLSVAEVAAAVEVLTGLEAMATEPACARITAAELDAVERLHGLMIAHHRAGALLDYFHVNQAIHQAIVDAAGNPVLSRLYGAESRRIWRHRYAGNLEADRWDRAIREHALILEALRARNGPLLRELLRAHLAGGWAAARARLAEQPPAPSAGRQRKLPRTS